ncbi:MAG: HAD family hydrolase [Clostridia bacterium]|nr:HAD family hydrolase [Clostridia bacterium]
MDYKAVLFDLDGTLLPLDQDTFIKAYFGRLAARMAKHGYEPKQYLDTILKGTVAMRSNDGSRTNEEAFWEVYCNAYGETAREDEPILDDFYRTDFQSVREVTHVDPEAAETVRRLREKGVPVIVATSPMFPPVATESRIRWAELNVDDFEMVTTYDNINYCKPDPEYYREICRRLDLVPEECVMVGNDVDEDMIAETVGMKVFLLTDNLLNRENKDISKYPQGGFAELREFLKV